MRRSPPCPRCSGLAHAANPRSEPTTSPFLLPPRLAARTGTGCQTPVVMSSALISSLGTTLPRQPPSTSSCPPGVSGAAWYATPFGGSPFCRRRLHSSVRQSRVHVSDE